MCKHVLCVMVQTQNQILLEKKYYHILQSIDVSTKSLIMTS